MAQNTPEVLLTLVYKYLMIYYVLKLREGNGNPLQYSCLENPTDGGAWWAAVHGFTKSRTRLSDFTFTFHFHALEKEMATHSSVLAWRIPGTGEPSGLPSMGSHRLGHDWSDSAAALKLQIPGHHPRLGWISQETKPNNLYFEASRWWLCKFWEWQD